jgi:hypothetical protein
MGCREYIPGFPLKESSRLFPVSCITYRYEGEGRLDGRTDRVFKKESECKQ